MRELGERCAARAPPALEGLSLLRERLDGVAEGVAGGGEQAGGCRAGSVTSLFRRHGQSRTRLAAQRG